MTGEEKYKCVKLKWDVRALRRGVGGIGVDYWAVCGPVGVVGEVVYIFGQEKQNNVAKSCRKGGGWREGGWDLALC